MGWQPTLYTVVAVGTAALSVWVAVTASQKRDHPGMQSFVALSLSLAAWALAYGVQLGFTTLGAQLVWQRAALAIGGAVPTLWLLFTLEYTGTSEWLTPRRQLLLGLEPVAFALLTLSNPWHGLVWQDATLSAAAQPVALLPFAVGYYLHIGYAYVAVTTGLVLVVVLLLQTSSLYRKQAGTLLLAAVPPFAANIAYTLGIDLGPTPGLDLTPFAFAVSGVSLNLALFQFDLLDRAPVARQRVLNEMGDGLVVLDSEGLVIESNPVAERIVAARASDDGALADVVAPETETDEAALATLHGETITATVDGRQRAYDVQVSTLSDHHDQSVGSVVALRDVTERVGHEERLQVTQRVLRHNLRNDMSVIRGWAEHLEATAADGDAEPARRIIDAVDELIHLADRTRAIVAMGEYGGDQLLVRPVDGVVEEIVAECRRANPDVEIEYDVPEGLAVPLPDEELLAVAVRNLIRNAVEHNDADEPWVSVTARPTGEAVHLSVADNGPGIESLECEVLEEGAETPLKHGSSIGTWLTHFSVATIGGDITCRHREGRGTVVTLALPGATGGSATQGVGADAGGESSGQLG